MNEIFNYEVQQVRDLAWAIFSPPLIDFYPDCTIDFIASQTTDDEKVFFLKLLSELNNNPDELIDFIEEKNSHLLGKYFETLIEFSFIKSPSKDLLATNLQINRGGNTIGELDFIYKDLITNEIIHLETSGKFFIALPNSKKTLIFLGPNPNDSLGKKLQKIKQTQINLTTKPETKVVLKHIGVMSEVAPKVLFKGYAFYHFNSSSKSPLFSHNHFTGVFARISEIENIKDDVLMWKILRRNEWVSPFVTKEKSELQQWEAILERIENYFTKENYPLLIAKFSQKEDFYFESERYFIISDNWPDDFNFPNNTNPQ